MAFLKQIIEFLGSEPSIGAFWGPLAASIIVFILNYLLFRQNDNKKSEKILTFRIVREEYKKHIIEIRHQKQLPQPIQSQAPARSSNDDVPVVIGAGVLLLSFFYIKYQTEIILAILSVSTFLLTYLIFSVVFAYRNSIIHGNDWKIYFTVTFGLIACAFPLMYLALHPLYSPERIDSMSLLVNNGGVTALFKSYGIAGFGFLMFQALGFLSLALAQLLQFLSLTFYMSITQIVVSDQKRPLLELVARATKRFSQPYLIIGTSIVLYVVSTILISGIAYEWWY